MPASGKQKGVLQPSGRWQGACLVWRKPLIGQEVPVQLVQPEASRRVWPVCRSSIQRVPMAVAGIRPSARLPAVRISQLTGAGASAALGAALVVRACAAATSFSAAAGRPAACAIALAASARRSILEQPRAGMLVASVPRRAGAPAALPQPAVTRPFARAGIWTAVELLQVPPRPALAARQPRGCVGSKRVAAPGALRRPWCRRTCAPASSAVLFVAASLPRPAHAMPGSTWRPLKPAALPAMRRVKAARPTRAALRGSVCAGRLCAAMP